MRRAGLVQRKFHGAPAMFALDSQHHAIGNNANAKG